MALTTSCNGPLRSGWDRDVARRWAAMVKRPTASDSVAGIYLRRGLLVGDVEQLRLGAGPLDRGAGDLDGPVLPLEVLPEGTGEGLGRDRGHAVLDCLAVGR